MIKKIKIGLIISIMILSMVSAFSGTFSESVIGLATYDGTTLSLSDGSVAFTFLDVVGLSYFTGNVNITGNVSIIGNLETTGNITATYFLGNGSLLTGITDTNTQLSESEVESFIFDTDNTNSITTTGNITANYFIGNGSSLTGINIGVTRTTTTTDYSILSTDKYVGVTDTSLERNITLPLSSDYGEGLIYIKDESGLAGTNNINLFGYPIGWDISSPVYFQNFSVVTETNTPNGLFFKPDGTKMYIIGSDGDSLEEYNLSIAWDISSSVYLKSLSVGGEQGYPEEVFFKPDGTKMYIIGHVGNEVSEYNLNIAWDISSSVYLQEFSISEQEIYATGLFFKPDGTKMYTIGQQKGLLFEYNLSIAWDVSSSVYSQNTSIPDSKQNGLFFKPDGTKMYLVNDASDKLVEYNLSIAWDISSTTYSQEFDVDVVAGHPEDVFFKPDGTKMYIVGSDTDSVTEYITSSLENINGASSYTIDSNYGSATLMSTGAGEWFTVEQDISNYYGGMYVYNNTIETTITSADVYYNITQGFQTGLLNGFTYSNGKLTVQNAGVYKLDSSVSFSGGNDDTYHTAISVNNVIQPNCHTSRTMSATGVVGNIGISCLLDLTAGDIINLQMEDITDGANIIVQDANIVIIGVGN